MKILPQNNFIQIKLIESKVQGISNQAEVISESYDYHKGDKIVFDGDIKKVFINEKECLFIEQDSIIALYEQSKKQ